MPDTNNNINLTGRLKSIPVYDHSVYGEAFFKADMSIKRLSGTEDVLPLTISERLCGAMPVKAGMRLNVRGQIRSYNQRTETGSRLLITVFAKEFSPISCNVFPDNDLSDVSTGASIDTDGSAAANMADTADMADITDYMTDETDVNEAELTGYVCKPVIYRTTPFSREIADMLLAVNRKYGKSDYLPCIAWGRNARFLQTVRVGERLHLLGRLQSREYKKTLESGEICIRTAYEISCSAVEPLY